MKVVSLPSLPLVKYDKLIHDYLSEDENLKPFISAFPSLENFEQRIAARKFPAANRKVLVDTLHRQYEGHFPEQEVKSNIELLAGENTFTVTTGHQLCLFTGPLYFIYKIVSTIRLAKLLGEKYPGKRFVPVYWMATEDHDFAEINHAFFYGRKINWETTQTGAVGEMNTDGIQAVINELEKVLGNDINAASIIHFLQEAYKHETLADATRYLVNSLFGKYGLVIVDGNNRELKSLFKATLKHELFEQNSFKSVTQTNEQLHKLGYKTQVNPREINLFYLEKGLRARIEQKDENTWQAVDTNITFSRADLERIIEETPEALSPNVIVRPLYQETILPNIAFTGGPGEIAYWLQLKSFFEKENIPFPVLVLRDSAWLISQKVQNRIEKLGIEPQDLLGDKNDLIKQLVHSEQASLETEKEKLLQLFEQIVTKVKAIDNTLENAAKAEAQKQISSLEHLEKKAIKALKQKEEIKINQLNKLYAELIPEGIMQERYDNFFQHRLSFGDELIESLMSSFDPLEKEFRILYQ